jgi:hypothetical protein
MGIRGLIDRVRRTFTPLEKRLLEAVADALPHDARERYEQQLEGVNKVQRLGAAREVNLYRMHGGRPYNAPELAFADQRLEAELARVRFRLRGEEQMRKVSLYAVRGFLFSLVFDPPAGPVSEQNDVSLLDVELMSDPMRQQQPAGARPVLDAGSLSGELGRWHARCGLTEVRRPLNDGEWQKRRSEIPARLPQGYLELTQQTEGFNAGPWKVYGLGETYGISLDQGQYQVLAELRDRGVLAVRHETSDLYFVPYDGQARKAVASFAEEIESCLP